LRFNNDQVFLESEAVLEVIADALDGGPSPRRRRGEGVEEEKMSALARRARRKKW
jgi:hypothetical protein